MALERVTEEFVRHYKALRDRSGNSPNGVRAALEKHPELAVSVRELDRIWSSFVEHRKFAKFRFIIQSHPEFYRAYRDYERHWKGAYPALLDWEDIQAGVEPLSARIDRLLDEAPGGIASETEQSATSWDDDDDWSFDPDEHSAAELIEELESYLSDTASNRGDPHFFRWAKALGWLRDTVGMNFKDIERRWHEFPVIPVAQHVSDQYSPNKPDGLFGYINEIRIAYVFKADQAAIAMCRAVTEVLIRSHYCSADDLRAFDNTGKKQPDLIPLINVLQKKRAFKFLEDLHLIENVKKANDILHSNKPDYIALPNHMKGLVISWVTALTEMINKAPERT